MQSLKSTLSKYRIPAKGQEIYERRLREKLEPEFRGQIIAIEVDSGDYFLGAFVVEAVREAKKKYRR